MVDPVAQSRWDAGLECDSRTVLTQLLRAMQQPHLHTWSCRPGLKSVSGTCNAYRSVRDSDKQLQACSHHHSRSSPPKASPCELHLTNGVYSRQGLAPHKHVHLADATLQRILCVVECRRTAPEDCDTLANKAGEVDAFAGVGIETGREAVFDDAWDVPLAATLFDTERRKTARSGSRLSLLAVKVQLLTCFRTSGCSSHMTTVLSAVTSFETPLSCCC